MLNVIMTLFSIPNTSVTSMQPMFCLLSIFLSTCSFCVICACLSVEVSSVNCFWSLLFRQLEQKSSSESSEKCMSVDFGMMLLY